MKFCCQVENSIFSSRLPFTSQTFPAIFPNPRWPAGIALFARQTSRIHTSATNENGITIAGMLADERERENCTLKRFIASIVLSKFVRILFDHFHGEFDFQPRDRSSVDRRGKNSRDL